MNDEVFPPVAWSVVERLTAVLWECTLAGVPHPVVHPHRDGGVRMAWGGGRARVDVDLLNDGAVLWSRHVPGGAPFPEELAGARESELVRFVAREYAGGEE